MKERHYKTFEELEELLFQKMIDLEEGRLGIEEAQRFGEPAPDELARWDERLDKLVKHSVQHRRRNWKRIIIAAAIIAAVLTITVLAVHTNLLNFIETVQEQFTQFSPAETPESIVSEWLDPYLPAYVPAGYMMSDAVDNGGTKAVEYTNSEGIRFTFYQSGGDTNIRIDTETAETEDRCVGREAGYLVQKNGSSSLHWNTVGAAFSIEYDPIFIEDKEALRIAESIAKVQIKGDDRE